jgi:putative tryptophan/tyrosine transport system substrate-binding protein
MRMLLRVLIPAEAGNAAAGTGALPRKQGPGITRIFAVVILALSAVVAPAKAQEPARIPRIGFVAPQGRSLPLFDAFRQGLAEVGYVEGQNVVIEPRFADGHYERFPDILAELLSLKVDILVVTGAVTARAAQEAATHTPIVFAIVVDPVADKVVPSMERAGRKQYGCNYL